MEKYEFSVMKWSSRNEDFEDKKEGEDWQSSIKRLKLF